MITIKDAEEILKKEYHIDNFLYLVKNCLFTDFLSDNHEIKFNSSIFNNVTQLGESKVCEISIFEVILRESSHNKRVAITQEMFKILRGLHINNAMVAFVNADENNYRISLLTSKYEYDGEKIIKVISNPRRYSYSLGHGTKTMTPYKFLIEKGRVNNLEELIARFSVEVVNKQFYNDISEEFTKLVGGARDGKKYERLLKLQSIVDQNKFAEFAVRLIGRIVFCWFLKEKKSDKGIPLVSEEILSLSAIKTNYYHQVLEPLFFELLNTKTNRRKDKFATEDKYKAVPYLNGGLFSPHADDHYKYDIVSQCGAFGLVNIKDEWFKEFLGVLNQYNFTVDENTSYDVELSIDPEMLGRIFENLLAEINPETGESARKSTGSFYTPRDIVDYMVDSSLFEYLKEKTQIRSDKLEAIISYGKEDDEFYKLNNDERKMIINALYTLTILDPACGSGAFPIGMLQKIVYILQEIDSEANLWFDKVTEHIPLIVKKEFEKKFHTGSLDYIRKLCVIQNSIFGIDIQPIAVEIARLRCFLSLIIEEQVDDNAENRGINPLPNLDFKFVIANTLINLENEAQINIFEDNDHIEELKAIREEYFNVESERRAELREEFYKLQKEMTLNTIQNYNKVASGRYQALSAWKPFENEKTDWFDPEWMFGVKNGFDIVIANPPYFVYQKEHVKEINRIKNQNYAKYMGSGKLNAFRAFIARTFSNLLSASGLMCMIFQNSFLGDKSAGGLRKYILEEHSLIRIDSFPERDDPKKRVFENVKMSVCIVLAKRGKTSRDFILNLYSEKHFKLNYSSLLSKSDVYNVDPIGYSIPMLTQKELQVFLKIYKNHKFEFKAIEGEINMTFHKHLLSTDATKPEVLKGAAIQRYFITTKMSQGIHEYLDVEKYIKENSGEKSKHFKERRIAMQGITGVDDKQRFVCTIVPAGFYLANSCNYILEPSNLKLEYILGLLNSKLINWVFKKMSTNSNVNCYEVTNLPIINFVQEIESKIISYVQIALQSKQNSTSIDAIENEINSLVYKGYNLTEEEIRIVENS